MLRVDRLRLEVDTPSGLYGTDVSFGGGLNVVRADNSMGKSTVLQAILFGLGLEPMLGPRHEIPLPHAMTEGLTGEDGTVLSVLESRVLLEIANGDDQSLTLRRWAMSESIDHRLIQVQQGRALTERLAAGPTRDYYVRLRGAATSESGFIPLLAAFIGWHLPSIIGSDGDETLLYPEIVFPLMFVEQKRGWGGIHVYVPPYSGIPEARRRALEFVLDLDVYERMRRRIYLRSEQHRIRERWRGELEALNTALEPAGVVADGVPREPSVAWPPPGDPRLLSFSAKDEWESLDDLRWRLRARLEDLEAGPAATAEEASGEVEADLARNESELAKLLEQAREVARHLDFERRQRDSATRRVRSLEEDERRYQDALTVRRLGGTPLVNALEGECPTCHRPLPDVLLAEQLPQPMSLDDNLKYLREQRQTFNVLADDSERLVRVRRHELDSLRLQSRRLRRQVRSARATLVAPAHEPAEAIVRERIELIDRLEELDRVEERFDVALARFEEMTKAFATAVADLRSAPSEGLSGNDVRKLDTLRESFVDQLESYGFSSVIPRDLEISHESYQPSLEGIDLGFDLSASDWIRIVWAYLIGLLEVSRTETTNHPKLVVFDEPRQQSADPVSLEALLGRAATSRRFGEQVLFATSEPTASLEPMLADIDVVYRPFAGHVLAPLERLTS